MSNYVPLSRSSLVVHADGSFTYNYGPSGVSGLFSNSYALLCAVFVSIGGLSFGYDQGVIANVLVMKDFVQRWPVTPLEKGIMSKYAAVSSHQTDAFQLLYLNSAR